MTNYLSGDWGHIFEGEDHERSTRIVVDADARKLVFAQVQRIKSMESSYSEAIRCEMQDLEDSLLNANDDIFETPGDYGLVRTVGLPGWAVNLV